MIEMGMDEEAIDDNDDDETKEKIVDNSIFTINNHQGIYDSNYNF